MNGTADNTMHRLLVTGPDRESLYDLFSRLFYGRTDVEVICDRRFAERRNDHRGPGDGERRRTERRRDRLDWVVPPDVE